MTSPTCPHGTKTLSADSRNWLCPSSDQWYVCPEEAVTVWTKSAEVAEVKVPPKPLPADVVKSVPVWEWQKAIRDSDDVTGKRQEVAFVLSTYATSDTGRDVRPAAATVAKAAGIQRQNVYTHIQGLAGDGWLSQYATAGRGVKVYALTLPERQVSAPADM